MVLDTVLEPAESGSNSIPPWARVPDCELPGAIWTVTVWPVAAWVASWATALAELATVAVSGEPPTRTACALTESRAKGIVFHGSGTKALCRGVVCSLRVDRWRVRERV